ncbi:MAG: hypothetical protein WBQ23_00175 [Bacteroidota bacterium]
MIGNKSSHISQLLTLYLDDRLDMRQREELERRIAQDEHVRREFEELRRMRALLASREPLPANTFLIERTINRIKQENDRQPAGAPLPRRSMPAMTGAFAMLIIAALAFAWFQRDQILRYVGNTGSQMQIAYEDSILKGWIMPLFQRTDKDQVLQFAMFGTLPLDEKDGTLLRVDENAERGYQVQLASNTDQSQPLTTIHELYREIQPTDLQRKVFDTLFLYAQRKIEAAVLMNQARQIAIDPAISKYNKVILSGIASSLDPDQLQRFDEFLKKRNTPYTFVSQRTMPPPPSNPAMLMERFRTVRAAEEFVILDDDGYTITRLNLDMDSLRRLMKIVEQRMPRIEVRVQDIARSYAISGQPTIPAPPGMPHGVRVMPIEASEGGHAISISIDSGGEIMRELEQEFENLRHEVVIFRRESSRLNEQLPLRSPDQLRAAFGSGRSRRVTVTVGPDTKSMFTVEIDTSIDQTGEHLEDIRIDLHNLLENAPEGSRLDWKELVPTDQRSRIDSVLREAGVEKFLKNEEVDKLRRELLLEEQLENEQARKAPKQERFEPLIIPAPQEYPQKLPHHIPPATPPPVPSVKDSVIEI